MRNELSAQHGLLPLLSLLDECKDATVQHALLKTIASLTTANSDLLETMCFLGGVPLVTRYTHESYADTVRHEASGLVRKLFETNDMTRRCLASCGGLHILITLLNQHYATNKILVFVGIDGLWSFLTSASNTAATTLPKNDFCLVLSKRGTILSLVEVMNEMLFDDLNETTGQIEKVIEMLNVFSRSSHVIKEAMANRLILQGMFYAYGRLQPRHQLLLLKCMKNLSVVSTVLDTLQKIKAGPKLVELLAHDEGKYFREIRNQALYILFNFCRVSKQRQEICAVAGILPYLKHLVKTQNPLKEFALPILCDLAHGTRVSREVLWREHTLDFYLWLLGQGDTSSTASQLQTSSNQTYWQVAALEAIAAWLVEEPERVEQALLKQPHPSTLVSLFANAKSSALPNLLPPYQKLMIGTAQLVRELTQGSFMMRLLNILRPNTSDNKSSNRGGNVGESVSVKIWALKILMSIVRQAHNVSMLVDMYNLEDALAPFLSENQQSDSEMECVPVLVREMASKIMQDIRASGSETDQF